jgi:hypothetical protein
VGAFNRLRVPAECPACGAQIERAFQFKFADKWQYDYRLGDRLRWGGNDEGLPGLPAVRINGVPEDCPKCRCDYNADGGTGFMIVIENDVIQSVEGPTTFTRLTYRSPQDVAATYERLLNALDVGDRWSQRHPGSLSDEIETAAGEYIWVHPPNADLSGRAKESVVDIFHTVRADELDPPLRNLDLELADDTFPAVHPEKPPADSARPGERQHVGRSALWSGHA